MYVILAAAGLAFALNAEPASKPYGPGIDTQTAHTKIGPAAGTAETTARTRSEVNSRDDDANRAYTCVDDKCKTVSPVYNTRTPMEADARPFRTSW